VALSFGEDLLAPDVGHPEADELVPELLVLATLDGLVEKVLFGAGRFFWGGRRGGGRAAGGLGGLHAGVGDAAAEFMGRGFTPRQPQVHAALTPSSCTVYTKFTPRLPQVHA